jgi:pimeloyl-ACP methyl ester carboxylesterase
MTSSGAATSPVKDEEMQKLAPWAAPGSFFDGTHYIIQGSDLPGEAETVICMHGIGSFYIFWKPLADFLSNKGYKVIFYDFIGRGFSQESKTGFYRESDHIDQIRSLIEHLQLTSIKLHFIGHSMGGALATLYASKFPENVKSLTLLAPAGTLGYFPLQCAIDCCSCCHGCGRSYLSVPTNQEHSWRHAYYKPQGQALINLEYMIGELHRMYANNSHAHDAFWKSALQFPLTNIQNEIQSVARQDMPILFLWGKNDIIVPISNLSTWMSVIKKERQNLANDKHYNVEIKIFDKCGHSIMGEHRQETLETIANFLSSKSSIVINFDKNL